MNISSTGKVLQRNANKCLAGVYYIWMTGCISSVITQRYTCDTNRRHCARDAEHKSGTCAALHQLPIIDARCIYACS